MGWFHRIVAVLIIINATSATPVGASSLAVQGAWERGDSDSRSWLVIAPENAPLNVEPVGFRWSGGDEDKPTTGSLASLEGNQRDEAMERIESLVSVRFAGWLRFWPIHVIEARPEQRLKINRRQVHLDSLDILLSGIPESGADGAASIEPLRLDRDWGYAAILNALVENPEHAARFAERNPPASGNGRQADWTPEALPPGRGAFRFAIDSDGPRRILPGHFKEHGLYPQRINPARIRLFSRGEPVSIERFDDGDIGFEEGESILFYGRQSESPYSAKRVYWVVYDTDAPQASLPRLAPPPHAESMEARRWHLARERIEQDEFDEHIEGRFLEIREIRWVWAPMQADAPTTATFPLPDLTLSADAPDELSVEFEFLHMPEDSENMKGATPISHRKASIELNGEPLGEVGFSGANDQRHDFTIERDLLRKSNNEIRIQLEPKMQGVDPAGLAVGSDFDSITVEYPKLSRAEDDWLEFNVQDKDLATTSVWRLTGFSRPADTVVMDVTNPERPALLSPVRRGADSIDVALRPGNERRLRAFHRDQAETAPPLESFDRTSLRQSEAGADYLIIAHPMFHDTLQPLIEFKVREGFSTRLVNIYDIYNDYSYGELDPRAIRDFLRHALTEWSIPPTYVLLFGDATADYRNELRVDIENLVPTQRQSDQHGSTDRWASEHWFTRLAGDDDLRDVILGRLSPTNVEDAKALVDKTIQASDSKRPGPWRNTALLVADNESEFTNANETIRTELLPPWMFIKKVYLDEQSWERNYYLDEQAVNYEDLKVSTAATQAILSAINTGLSFMVFTGHGAPNIWTDERIWFGMDSPNSDNLLLTNADRLPFAINFTCNTGAFDYPRPRFNICITEDMMRVRGGGTRSILAPSGPGVTSGHLRFGEFIIPALYSRDMVRQGDALTAGIVRYVLGREHYALDYARMYILLGDPSMPFIMPRETVELRAPDQVNAFDSPSTIDVELIDPPFESGRVAFRFERPQGDSPSANPSVLSFNPRRRVFAIELPEEENWGEWRLKAYLWNSELEREAAGWTPVKIAPAFASIERFRLNRPANENLPARLQLDLKNPSDMRISGLRFEIARKRGTTYSEVLAVKRVDLAPGESNTWEVDWRAPHGLHELRARLLNYDRYPPTRIEMTAEKEIAWSNPDPSAPARIEISHADLERRFVRELADGQMEFEASGVARLAAGEFSGQFVIGHGFGDDYETTRSLTMNKARKESNPFRFRKTLERDRLPAPLSIAIDPFGETEDLPPDQGRLFSSFSLDLLPDLAFDRRLGVGLDPPRPVDGRTVFFYVPIRNRGGTDAGAFRVSGYEKDPEQGGKPLVNRAKPSQTYVEFEGLAAGQTAEAVLRWDPKDSAGEQTVYFKIDTLERIEESNEANNVAPYTFEGRTLAELEPVNFELKLLPRLRVEMRATLRNKGETEARNVAVAFFSDREMDPDNRLVEHIVERIGPGETHTERYVRQLPESFREKLFREGAQVHGSAQFYLRGSLQRIQFAPSTILGGN